jgi:signal transduction protein with GAF and PtsI domain
MKELLKQEFEIDCPGGGRPTKMRLERILSSSSIKTPKGEYKLKSSDKSKISSHLRNMERETQRFQKQMEKDQKEFFNLYAKMLSNSDIVVKR